MSRYSDESCWSCGDGIQRINGEWTHSEDLGINVDGTIATTSCDWGKPYAPSREAS